MKIRVLQLRTGYEEANIVTVENELKDLQALVGGYLETLRVDEDIYMWLNEEGKLDGLDGNFNLRDSNGKVVDVIVGDVFFSSIDDEGETIGLTDEQIERVKSRFAGRWNFAW